MQKVLSDAEVARYREEGFLTPIDLLGPDETAELNARFDEIEAASGGSVADRFRIKAHLPFPWLCDLIAHPRLLDVVEDVIGPDILCWGSSFFIKEPGDGLFISWHTDSFFYGTRPADTLTAWISFNASDLVSGCVRFIPGSHKTEAVHELRPDPRNLASNGQTAVGVDESTAVDAILMPGQFSLHHESVVHGSSPNLSDHKRVGLSIHYCAPHVRETRFDGATAMLLRGEDRTGNWMTDPRPTRDFDPDCIDMMNLTLARFQAHTNAKVAAGDRT